MHLATRAVGSVFGREMSVIQTVFNKGSTVESSVYVTEIADYSGLLKSFFGVSW